MHREIVASADSCEEVSSPSPGRRRRRTRRATARRRRAASPSRAASGAAGAGRTSDLLGTTKVYTVDDGSLGVAGRSVVATRQRPVHHEAVAQRFQRQAAHRRQRRPRQLQVVGALLHEPRDAHRHDQLGHADHRPSRPGAKPAHQSPRARLGDPLVHDRIDRAGSQRRSTLGPLRAQARLHRRLRPLRGGVAGRRVLRLGDRAHRVAAGPGGGRRAALRQRPGDRHRRLPEPPARRRHGHQHDDRRRRAGPRARPRWRARGHLLAVGVLVQRAAEPRRRAVGVRSCSTRWAGATRSAGSTWPARSPSSSA